MLTNPVSRNLLRRGKITLGGDGYNVKKIRDIYIARHPRKLGKKAGVIAMLFLYGAVSLFADGDKPKKIIYFSKPPEKNLVLKKDQLSPRRYLNDDSSEQVNSHPQYTRDSTNDYQLKSNPNNESIAESFSLAKPLGQNSFSLAENYNLEKRIETSDVIQKNGRSYALFNNNLIPLDSRESYETWNQSQETSKKEPEKKKDSDKKGFNPFSLGNLLWEAAVVFFVADLASDGKIDFNFKKKVIKPGDTNPDLTVICYNLDGSKVTDAVVVRYGGRP